MLMWIVFDIIALAFTVAHWSHLMRCENGVDNGCANNNVRDDYRRWLLIVLGLGILFNLSWILLNVSFIPFSLSLSLSLSLLFDFLQSLCRFCKSSSLADLERCSREPLI